MGHSRNDTGSTLAEMVVVMVVVGFMGGAVLAAMAASLKLLHSAPSDTNPHIFGASAAAVARFEASLVPDLACTNPAGVNSRRGCVEIEVRSAASRPVTHDGHTGCRVVATGDGRRLECWELLAHGDLVAHRYPPDIEPVAGAEAGTCTASVPVPGDCLSIPAWADTPDDTLPVVSGLAAVAWLPAEPARAAVAARPATATEPATAPVAARPAVPARFEACAAIRPDQRQLIADAEVPFCDGTFGVTDSSGAARTASTGTVCTDPAVSQRPECAEGHPMGHPMPALRLRT